MFNNIRHLKYIATVAKCGSLFKAARKLMVSESAVSAAIKACEQEIGYSIFIRRPATPLALTRTGAEFVRSAQHFVDHAEAFYEQSVGFGTQLKGTIRLGCFSAFSSLLLPPIMRYCQEHLPMLTLQIFEHDLPEMLSRLRTGDVEIAITYDLLYDSDITFRALFSVTPHIGVSAANHLADHQALRLTRQHPVGDRRGAVDPPVTRQHILKLFVDHGITPNVLYHPKSIDTLHALIAHDFGYSIFFMRPNYVSHGGATLKRLSINDDVPNHNVVIAFSKNVQLTAKVSAIADACAAIFADRELVESFRYRRPDDPEAMVYS